MLASPTLIVLVALVFTGLIRPGTQQTRIHMAHALPGHSYHTLNGLIGAMLLSGHAFIGLLTAFDKWLG